MRIGVLCAIMTAVLPVPAAMAGDLSVLGGASISFAPGGDASSKVDLNGYLEADLANFYLGASTDIYNDSNANEIDLDIGYRNTLANGLGYDLSYNRAFYPNQSGAAASDATLSLSMPLGDAVTVTAETKYYVQDKVSATHLTLDYLASDKITLTGKVGRDGTVPGKNKEWEVAGTYALGAQTGMTVHYYDGQSYKGYFGLDLTWDTTLLGG